MSELLTIAELARRTGVKTSALRYYDELGLVRPTRRVSGHRRYAVDAVAAVAVVRLLQEVGFTLAETKRLMDCRKRSPVAWRSVAVRKSKSCGTASRKTTRRCRRSSTPSSAAKPTSLTAQTSGQRL